MTKLKKVLVVKPGRQAIFTLDRDAGLVVDRRALVDSGTMDRQFRAAMAFYDKKKAEDSGLPSKR